MKSKLQNYINYLNQWIINYCKQANTKGIVVGISGGIDSTLVATIANLNKKIKVIGAWMNIENSKLDLQCLNDLKKQNQYPIMEFNLLSVYQQYKKILKVKNKLALANLKARIRMSCLYTIAQENNLLVAGTGNADELYMGYFTKYGDGGCDILPIAHLNKSQISIAANLLKLPSSIINRAPTASLYDGQTDEKEMGVTYNDIDNFLDGKKIDKKAMQIIKQYHQQNLHKFNLPVKPDKKIK